jgi:hypothetical protein
LNLSIRWPMKRLSESINEWIILFVSSWLFFYSFIYLLSFCFVGVGWLNYSRGRSIFVRLSQLLEIKATTPKWTWFINNLTIHLLFYYWKLNY